MKKYFVLVAAALFLMSAGKKDSDGVITKEDGRTVVNTTTICKSIEGYAGPVPLKIYIKKNKVEKVEFLKNQETPKYMARVKKAMLNKWDGLKVKDAAEQKVDGVTGATFSSEAIAKNVQLALEYYQKHK